MEFNPTPIEVFFKVRADGCILDVNSSIFLRDTTEWVKADEGYGDRYALAQGNYLPGPTRSDEGIPRYRWDGEAVMERTLEEIASDLAAITPPPLTEEEKLKIRLQAAEQAILGLMMKNITGGLPL